MAIVDVSNRPWVVEIVPDNVVAEFTDESLTVEVPNGTPLVEFRCCDPGAGGAGGALQFQDEGINLGANDSDTLNFVGGLVEATRAGNTVTATIAAASDAETDAGTVDTKGVTPESGAFAYDRLRHPGQHEAGKGTECVVLTSTANVVAIDAALSNVFRHTLTENTTFSKPTNLLLGQVMKLTIEQDDTGGWTGAFHPDILFPFGLTPIVSTAPGAIDLVSILHDEATGLLLGSYMPDYTGTGTGWGIMIPGPPGPAGPPGAPGTVGATGPAGTPAGGLTGQVLMKTTDDDYDADWASIGELTLSGLGDVDVTGLVDGQALIWDTTTSTWLPGNAGNVAADPIWDAKGDLAVGTTADIAVRLAVGTDGQVLAANSTQPTGLQWIDPPAGGGGGGGGGSLSFVASATVTGSPATTLTLSGLDLDTDSSYLIDFVLDNAAGSTANWSLFYNGDTTATNYDTEYHGANGSSDGSSGANNAIVWNGMTTGLQVSGHAQLRHNFDGRAAIEGMNNYTNNGVRAHQTFSHTWRTVSNVTSITISSSVASAFAVGSKIRVWKLNEDFGGAASVCVVARIALQNFNTTAQAVSWDTEEADTEGYYSGANPTYVTFPASGWYTVIGTVWQSGDADDIQTLWFAKNGAAYSATQTQTRMGTGSVSIAGGTNLSETAYYAAGDYIELYVDNRSGSSSANARMSVYRMSGPTGPQGAQGPVGDTAIVQLRAQEDDLVITSNAAFQDTDLVSGTLQPGIYALEIVACTTCHATPDLKRRIDFTGTAVDVLMMYTTDGVASGAGYYSAFGAATDGTQTTTGAHITTIHGKFTVTVAGQVKWQIGQVTSSATSITFQKGSWMRVTELTGVNENTIDDEIAADSPHGYWKLDEASGNLVDSSGNGYTLTITGTPVQGYQFAALDGNFPTRKTIASNNGGQNHYAASASALGLTLPITTYTMEAWGKWTSTGIAMAIGRAGETAVDNFAGQLLIDSGGTLNNFWESGTGTNQSVGASLLGGISDGQLHHIILVKDAATTSVKYYIDGQYAGGAAYTGGQEHTSGTSGVFSIIGSPGDSTAAPDGVYGGCAFYTTALSEARIQAHARALGVF